MESSDEMTRHFIEPDEVERRKSLRPINEVLKEDAATAAFVKRSEKRNSRRAQLHNILLDDKYEPGDYVIDRLQGGNYKLKHSNIQLPPDETVRLADVCKVILLALIAFVFARDCKLSFEERNGSETQLVWINPSELAEQKLICLSSRNIFVDSKLICPAVLHHLKVRRPPYYSAMVPGLMFLFCFLPVVYHVILFTRILIRNHVVFIA
eukprot:Blabericola_migrator_1__9521@NODE_517_length_7921_cov_221_621976_g395_i0_p4_GENE_NODE_517_length_7921_cov_221_621976_g395_i0NODE_517_length_7921_cov_221_621976_g395_i0_p4_ORF_typecomplete_len209_score30_39_NODE_517_length_7921_cov_221_621976_g395_i013952021